MAVTKTYVTGWADNGDGNLTVRYHTPGGNDGQLVMPSHLLGTSTASDMLQVAGSGRDLKAAVLRAAGKAQEQE